MYNKTYRPTKPDAVGLVELVLNDPRAERKQSLALQYAFHDAYQEAINGNGHLDWNTISKLSFDDSEIVIDESVYASPNSFSVEEEVWDYLVDDIKSELGIQKVRISYMVRLIILFARKKLRDEGRLVSEYLKELDTDVEPDEEANEEIPPQVIVNLIEGLQKLSWPSEDITDFMLYVCSGEEQHIEKITNRRKKDD